ncbi:hypothetical protein [uncultured Azohydromonas sp.]|jgi:hypothetical protein|uniref:hypothetical protein n=1 Tax=uncultured Azohydromonas sp. TaxID=487342 RepID=UPI00261B12C6|nr:hypothetical protein [uncultured Azohydromonas sp.]
MEEKLSAAKAPRRAARSQGRGLTSDESHLARLMQVTCRARQAFKQGVKESPP